MDTSLKSRSFKFVYWIMLLVLAGDTIDTNFRFISGFFGDGSSFPGVDVLIKPTIIDFIIFLIVQVGIIYGIYLLYKLKKVGGYWFIGSNIFFLIYASIFGPIAQIGISNIIAPIILFFCIYFLLAILIPWFYADKFE